MCVLTQFSKLKKKKIAEDKTFLDDDFKLNGNKDDDDDNSVDDDDDDGEKLKRKSAVKMYTTSNTAYRLIEHF